MKKVLITTGGSGGHVMPSLSVYDALKDNFEVHIATDLRGSKYIDSGSYNYSIIDVPKLSTSFLLIIFNLIKFCFSILKSYKYLKLNVIFVYAFSSKTIYSSRDDINTQE